MTPAMGLRQLIDETARSALGVPAEAPAAIKQVRAWLEQYEREFPRSTYIVWLYHTYTNLLDAAAPDLCVSFLADVERRYQQGEYPRTHADRAGWSLGARSQHPLFGEHPARTRATRGSPLTDSAIDEDSRPRESGSNGELCADAPVPISAHMADENSKETQALIAGEIGRVCFLERHEAKLARRCVVRLLGQLTAVTFATVLVVQGALFVALTRLEAHAKHAIVAIVVTSGWGAFILARATINQAIKPWRLAVHDTTSARMRLKNLLGS